MKTEQTQQQKLEKLALIILNNKFIKNGKQYSGSGL